MVSAAYKRRPDAAVCSDGPRRSSRLALLLLLLLFEVSAVVLPVQARVPARSAAAITETRLRAEPQLHAAPLLRLPEGAVVTVHGKAEDGWYRARRGRLEGFVRTGDLATDAVSASDAQPGEAIDAPQVVEQAQRAGGRNRERRQPRNDVTGIAGDALTATDLNMRHGPSRDTPVRAVIPRRVNVSLTGEHRDGYVEVTWNGETGWALGKHLTAPRPVAVHSDRDPTSWSRRELIAIIYDAADRYGQPREDMLRVARCESDLVPSAVNGPGGSYGLFQFKPGTWLGTPFAEYDIFDPRASANAAAWMWSVGRRREWVCQ
ncbi:MAG: transglycosylase SLT domain-containing protein [Thermomicrobiales bacterium]